MASKQARPSPVFWRAKDRPSRAPYCNPRRFHPHRPALAGMSAQGHGWEPRAEFDPCVGGARMKISATSLLVMLITAPAVMRPSAVLADAPCAGHEMLSTPRDEASCDSSVKPQAFPSPDAAVRAFVF